MNETSQVRIKNMVRLKLLLDGAEAAKKVKSRVGAEVKRMTVMKWGKRIVICLLVIMFGFAIGYEVGCTCVKCTLPSHFKLFKGNTYAPSSTK